MASNLWLLEGDEHVLGIAEHAGPGDYVVRRHGDLLEVGEVSDGDEPSVAWFGEVEQALLPTTEGVDLADDRRGPLQRIPDDGDLRAAIEGIATAERNRGG
jgi:hypothetical protein